MSAPVVIDLETDGNLPWKGELLVVGVGRKAYHAEEGTRAARMILARPNTTVVCHTNYDLRWLCLEGAKMSPSLVFHDTKVMAWMLDPTQELSLEACSMRYLDDVPPKHITVRQGQVMFKGVPIKEAPWHEVAEYNESDLAWTGRLYNVLRQKLIDANLWNHFITEEAPFSKVLIEMEVAGMPFDEQGCRDMMERAALRRDELGEDVLGSTNNPDFNPRSVPLLGKFLYEKKYEAAVKIPVPKMAGMTKERKVAAIQSIAPDGMTIERVGTTYAHGTMIYDGLGLKKPRQRTKKGEPSTSAKVLELLYGDHPWVEKYLEWKKLDRLIGTFLESWLDRCHDGRLHGRLDQAATVTGRLSSKDPNMQQVPTSKEWNVRSLFAGPMVVGDYAGLEVRLSAHFSKDPLMLEIFRNGDDLYGTLAAEAWGGPADKSNPGRGLMKVLMLSSQYGAQGAKLAEILTFAGMRHTEAEANKFLLDLERTLPRLFDWREEVIAEARVLGYVTTIGGRVRKLPQLGSAVWKLMAEAERQAVNSKVQGSAADVVRRAMLKARNTVDPEEAQLMLQVHDEILWARGPGYNAETFTSLMEACEGGHGFTLEVPLTFEAREAEAWSEKEGSAGQVRFGEYVGLGQ